MNNGDEKELRLEREYSVNYNAQKRFFESQIELLKSKIEYEKEKVRIEYEGKTEEVKKAVIEEYNVKNTKDAEAIKAYYAEELERQKQWYEKEIERKQQETANWHIAETERKIAELTKGYEEMLSALKDKYELELEVLSNQLKEQKSYYEEQLKPVKMFEKAVNILEKRINKFANLNSHNKDNNKSPVLIGEEKSKKIKIVENNLIDENQKKEITSCPEENANRAKVSVILPVYNVGKYLRESLDSLINQTLKDIEIICVNDGSTDDCYEILEEYKAKDARIKVIHKENKGTGAARNDGLRLATGECIGFVDPDDWVKPNMFERLYGIIKDENVDIAMCMPDGYDEKNKKNAPFPYFVDENFNNIPVKEVFNRETLSPFAYPMCVWNKLYTKELFDKNGIDFAEGLDFEDHKVIFGTLLTAEKIYFIKEKLYVYRYNREGSVLTDNNARLIDHIEIFNIVEKIMKETGTSEKLRDDFLTYKVHNLLYYYGMIKEEYKKDYYENMVKSVKDTNLTHEEEEMLIKKYPEFEKIVKAETFV